MLLLCFIVVWYVYMSFIKEATFIKYYLTQWIPKLRGCFKIHWVRQYLVYLMSLAGTVNAHLYKTEPIFTGLARDKVVYMLHTDNYLHNPRRQSTCASQIVMSLYCGLFEHHGYMTERSISLIQYNSISPPIFIANTWPKNAPCTMAK